ncbi:MAG: NAD(P)H-dependent amine dehydrogenase family protein [Acidimicrobiales bacterium]
MTGAGRGPRPLQVVQWATGNIGARALRAVIEHPRLELAGVWVHGADKEGMDAGDLCGTGPTGVLATRDVERILDLGADCVLYMPQGCDMDVVCRLLASGANVVTTRGELHRPASLPPDVRRRVDEACRRGASSVHSTGSSPGFITEVVPLALVSMERRLGSLGIEEWADLSRRASPELLLGLMGFGRPPEQFDPGRWAHGARSFGPSLRLVADAVGLPLDEVTGTGEVATARRTTTIAAGTIEAGTVAAQRMVVTGLRGGRRLLGFQATWYCTPDLDPGWQLHPTGWRVAVDGDVPMDVGIRFEVPLERMAELSPGFTANRAVNAVAAVCAAPPGIRTTADLPQVLADLGT